MFTKNQMIEIERKLIANSQNKGSFAEEVIELVTSDESVKDMVVDEATPEVIAVVEDKIDESIEAMVKDSLNDIVDESVQSNLSEYIEYIVSKIKDDLEIGDIVIPANYAQGSFPEPQPVGVLVDSDTLKQITDNINTNPNRIKIIAETSSGLSHSFLFDCYGDVNVNDMATEALVFKVDNPLGDPYRIVLFDYSNILFIYDFKDNIELIGDF